MCSFALADVKRMKREKERSNAANDSFGSALFISDTLLAQNKNA